MTHNISGTAKSAVQSLMALIFLREPISFEGAVGLFLVIFGSFFYGWVRDMEMAAKPLPITKYAVVDTDDDMELIEDGQSKSLK